MRISIREKVLLVSAILLAGTIACAQQPASSPTQPATFVDLGITYAPEYSELTPGNCCFWMQGGSADAALTFWKNFGIAASLNGDHASSYTSNIDLNKIAFLAGPRYTYTAWTGSTSNPRFQVFGQALVGGVHAFNGVFPSGTSTAVSSASSYAVQTGGGFNVFFSRNYAVRVFELDYVRTALPNGADNIQGDLRLAFGMTYHFRSTFRRK